MSRRTFWMIGLLALVVVVGGTAWVVRDDTVSYSHSLDRFGKGGLKNRFIHLDDGSQFSIGSPDRHRVVVQWKDRDGRGWTKPKTVWTEKKLRTSDNTVRYGGTAVAITQDFSTGGEYGDRTLVAMVCRVPSCDVKELPGSERQPQITPDGRYAYLGQLDGKLVLWTTEEGFRTVKRSGKPEDDQKNQAISDLVLAEDGSLRLLSGSSIPTGCAFDLGLAKPGTGKFSVVGRGEAATKRPIKYGCIPYVPDGPGADWIEVPGNGGRWERFWIVRRGDTWVTANVDPSGLVLNDYAVRGGYTTLTQNVNGPNLAVGSPDRHRFQVQLRPHDSTSWTKVQLLKGAPADLPCNNSRAPGSSAPASR